LKDVDLESAEVILVEAVIAPNSVLEGKSLKEIGFQETFRATTLAIRHRENLLHEKIGTTPLRGGDALLIEVKRDHLDQLQKHGAFVVVTEVGLPTYRRDKIPLAIAIILGVVITAALNTLPIVVSAIAGCVLMVLLGCITLEEAYKAIDWQVIFLLAGVLTLGIALEKTGAAMLLSGAIVSTVGIWGPMGLLSAMFLITTLLTNFMSNNGTAALLAPIAIATAESLGLSARPFLMAITFAASLSFMTPVGYQTNTMIYGPGRYTFVDFLRVGAPLNLIFWILGSIFIPYFWPF
jgi:di/tricarboxylate transporter